MKTQDQMQIEAVRDAGFPKYDKTLHSKCKRSDLYGIQRIPAAQRAIDEQPAKRPRKDVRQFKDRVSCRLPSDEYALLQQAFAASTDKTMQEFARNGLLHYANSILKKKRRPGADTPKAANLKDSPEV